MTGEQKTLEQSGLQSAVAGKENGKRPAEETEDKQAAEEQHDDKKAKTEEGAKTTEPAPEADATEPLTKSQPKNVVEEGRIYFFYRPRVGMKEAHSLSDIQRFYIVMAPTSRKGAPLRLAAVGKKQLPQLKGRFWACIQGISDKMDDLLSGLGPKENETKTMGTRRTEAARAAGEGVYTIADEGSEARLMYELEIPEEPQELQEQLNIGKTGDYSLQMKNPEKSSPPNLGLSGGQKVEYPKELQAEFEGTPGGYAWISPKNPALLDHLGAEFILIGANPDIGQVDKAVKEHLNEATEQDMEKYKKGGDNDDEMMAKLKAELHAEKNEISVAPAVEGSLK